MFRGGASLLEIWKITARPKTASSPDNNRRPSAISLFAWREGADERYNLVLENRGHYREMFASIIGREGADEVIAMLAANRAIQLPGAFTTRQLNSIGFRNLEQS